MKKQIVFFVSSLVWGFVLSDTCTTPLGVKSYCIPLLKCPQLLGLFDNCPVPKHVASFLEQSACEFKGHTLKVCCGPLPVQSSLFNIPSIKKTLMINEENAVGVEPASKEDSKPAPRNTCGMDTNGDKIFGGKATELDEFPWMALLGYRNSTRTGMNSISYECGGALINRRYVLTAAHCITGAIETKIGKLELVRLGEYDTRTQVDCLYNECIDELQEILVDVAYPHPGYKDDNDYVKPICLVSSGERLDVGMDVHVAGWGKTLDGTNSPVKIKLNMPIFDKTKCAKKYQKTGAVLTKNQICAGGEFAKDTCKGDSGGPLMKNNKGVWETVAVVSFAKGCGMSGWPAVYTSVAGYLDWIQSTMRSSNV